MKAFSLAATVATLLSFASGIASHEYEKTNSTVVELGGECGKPDLVCAEGLYCKDLTELSTMASSMCLPVPTMGKQTPPELRLRKRQTSFTAVTGAVTGRAPVNRLPVQVLQQTRPDIFNMLLFALYDMQTLAETNSLSYYQISGIHGRPFVPWQEAASSSQDTSTGYCTHDSGLFATWHRPYLALFEQRIVAHALAEANRFAAGATRDRWVTAARNVRLPYWDWSSSDLASSIPTIVRTAQVTITRAGTNGAPVQISIPNPLYSYRFTNLTLRNSVFQNPYRSDATTLRQPPSTRGTSNNALANQIMQASYNSRRQNTYNLFSIPSFREFSNTAFSAGGQPNGWTSVESIHNEIHVNIGGDGHMSAVDYSAFDPIFWLHHTNIDRLVAMYQAVYPGRVVTPQPASGTFARPVTSQNQQDTIDTLLNPFRKVNGQYFTSRDVSNAASIWALNYAYPEVPLAYQGRPASELASFTTARINALYGPTSVAAKKVKRQISAETTQREWIAHLVFAPTDIDGSAECLIFLGDINPNPGARRTADTLVGGGASFVKARPTNQSNRRIAATVPLTIAIQEAGIDPNNVVECVQYLRDNLNWVMQKGSEAIPLTSVPSLIVGVSSAQVVYSGGNELPKWGEFETFYEVTQEKTRGLTLANRNIVASRDVENVLAQVENITGNTVNSAVGASTPGTANVLANQ